MLRGDHPVPVRLRALLLTALLGIGAAALVALGNPGNMGLCGACFLRDLGGALKLHQAAAAIFRPEIPGIVFGALAFSLLTGRHVGRSGSHAVARFVLCLAMGIGSLVFLGCPFRLLQRLGGGDLSAWLAFPGFLGGVWLGTQFERRGYSIGRTSEVPLAVGLTGPVVVGLLLALFLWGSVLAGPGPGGDGPPAHASWTWALGIGGLAGAILSATGFCAIRAGREVFKGPRWMLLAACVLVLAYAATAMATGRFQFGLEGQPVAHGDWLWNTAALVLVGLCGVLAGGCPVRQVVMAGEGNGDALVGVAGLVVGGSLAHGLGLASVPAGPAGPGGATAAGAVATCLLLVLVLVYGFAMARPQPVPQPPA